MLHSLNGESTYTNFTGCTVTPRFLMTQKPDGPLNPVIMIDAATDSPHFAHMYIYQICTFLRISTCKFRMHSRS